MIAIADTLQQIKIRMDSLIELKIKLYADSLKFSSHETVPFMKEKLLGFPFWFWQFVIFPVFLFFLALFVNTIINKIKSKQRLATLKHHTEIWLRRIIESGKKQSKAYNQYAELLINFKEGAMSNWNHIINCKQILSIEKVDLNNLFLSKVIYPKNEIYQDELIKKDESENFTLLIENLEGIENNLKITNEEYDFIENLIENYQKEFAFKKQEIDALILEHELLLKPLLTGDDEKNYFLALHRVREKVLDGTKSKSISREEQLEKIFKPIGIISQDFFNKYPTYKPAQKIIYNCNQLQNIFDNNQWLIKMYGLAFRDYARQLTHKTSFNEKIYKRYKNAKVKHWIYF